MNASPLTPWICEEAESAPTVSTSPRRDSARQRAETIWRRARLQSNGLLPKLLYNLLPKPNFFLQYPLHVISTKSLLSGYIPRVPTTNPETLYAVINSRVARPEESAWPAGMKWLTANGRGFVRSVSNGVLDDKGKAVLQVEHIETAAEEMGLLKVAMATLRKEGLRGFFRAAVASHCVDLLDQNIERAVLPSAQSITKLAQQKASERREGDSASMHLGRRRLFFRRFAGWYRTEEAAKLMAGYAARLFASTLTYPLTTINIRRIAYEPFDGKPLGFLDMTRLTVLYDGPPALFAGFSSFVSAQLAQMFGSLCAHAAVCAADVEKKNSDLTHALLEQISPMLVVATGPLTQYSQQFQAVSRIPGLATDKPKIRDAIKSILGLETAMVLGFSFISIYARSKLPSSQP